MMRRIGLLLVIACLGAYTVLAREVPPPRIPPLSDGELTQEQRDIAASYVRGGQLTNDVRTLLNHPDAVRGVLPFWNYIAFQSTLTPHDRAMLMLRAAWRTNSPYLWARYATEAPLTTGDRRRLATTAISSATAESAFDELLIQMADELHGRSFVADRTWAGLAARYGTEQLMDAVFTVAETTMLAGIVNSLRVPVDAKFTARPQSSAPVVGGARGHAVLASPRIPPIEQTFWTGELRAMLDPDGTGRNIAAVYRTFAQHPALYRPRQELSEYIRVQSTLAPRIREMAILRIGYLCGSEYEWAAHVRAGRDAGLSEVEIRRLASRELRGWAAADVVVIQVVDELFALDTVSDATWARLAKTLDRRQLIDFLITTGGYRMVSMALNTFGVPLEPNSARFPS